MDYTTAQQIKIMQASLASLPARTVLRETFFSSRAQSDLPLIGVGYKKIGDKVAPIVSYDVHAKMVGDDAENLIYFKPPLQAPIKDIEIERLSPVLGADGSVRNRGLERRTKNLLEMSRMIDAREELMCAELLTTGKFSTSGDGHRGEEDFWGQLNAADRPFVDVGAVNATLYWSASTSDPLADIQSAEDYIQANGGLVANIGFIGSGAYAALRNNTAFLDLLDNRRASVGSMASRLEPNGARYVGTISGIDLFTYGASATYQTTAQAETYASKSLIPSNIVLLGSTHGRADSAEMVDVPMPHPDGDREILAPRAYDEYRASQAAPRMVQRLRARSAPVVKNLHAFRALKVLA